MQLMYIKLKIVFYILTTLTLLTVRRYILGIQRWFSTPPDRQSYTHTQQQEARMPLVQDATTPATPATKTFKFWNPTQPLGLPTGTVRAIMVLAFTAAVVIPLLKFSYMQQEIPQTVKEVILFMAGSLYPIIQAYFKARADETMAKLEGGKPPVA